ncbi:hypothetical protein GCM10027570_44770 [Streptomonospora sediminis]
MLRLRVPVQTIHRPHCVAGTVSGQEDAQPSFALMGAYELLMREFRTDARGVRKANADG